MSPFVGSINSRFDAARFAGAFFADVVEDFLDEDLEDDFDAALFTEDFAPLFFEDDLLALLFFEDDLLALLFFDDDLLALLFFDDDLLEELFFAGAFFADDFDDDFVLDFELLALFFAGISKPPVAPGAKRAPRWKETPNARFTSANR